MEYYMFAVNETPYCIWEHDLKERSLEFLESIDCEYFDYLADVNYNQIDGENKQRAAISLRSGFYHGLETLFILISALIQAPEAAFAYCQKSYPKDIKEIINKLNKRSEILNKYGRRNFTWNELSEGIHIFSNTDKTKAKEIASCFAELWKSFASEYLDEKNDREYNNIKHGFRARSGGFGISIRKEIKSGVPDPNEKPMSLGYSEFGSSFFISEHFHSKSNPNFRARRQALNWTPEALAYSLNLISMSVNNVVSYLKLVNGVKPEEVIFRWPKEKDDFDTPWKFNVGVTSSNFDFVITENDIENYTREEILRRLKANNVIEPSSPN